MTKKKPAPLRLPARRSPFDSPDSWLPWNTDSSSSLVMCSWIWNQEKEKKWDKSRLSRGIFQDPNYRTSSSKRPYTSSWFVAWLIVKRRRKTGIPRISASPLHNYSSEKNSPRNKRPVWHDTNGFLRGCFIITNGIYLHDCGIVCPLIYFPRNFSPTSFLCAFLPFLVPANVRQNRGNEITSSSRRVNY